MDVEEVKAKADELAQKVAQLELLQFDGTDGSSTQEDSGANEAQVIPQQKLRAFDVVCDGRETDPWLVYLPPGCISYAGFEPETISPAPDATTHLADIGSSVKDGGIYAHLYLELDEDSDSDSTSEQEVTGFQKLEIDTTPALTPVEDNIRIVNIKIATITDGSVAQNVSSSIIIGGSGGSGGGNAKDLGCYRIKRNGTSVSFENLYVQIAGKLYEGPSSTYEKSALAGRILAVKADVSSSLGQTSLTLQTYGSISDLQNEQEDTRYLIIPLYKFGSNGNVECDFRTVPYEWQMNYN